jgi:O-antigen ligase
MRKLAARWMALSALFLLPLTPLIVANSFFFPFITGKAFYFRVLAEIAVAGWAVLAVADARYRPKFTPVSIAVLAFIVWMFIADLFAPNAPKAFWSNFERMEGWVLLIHLGGFFLAASAVLGVERKWRAWFLTSLAVSVLVIGYAFFQEVGVLAVHQGQTRLDATFGNSIYLAIYLLFNVFIAGWLAFTEQRAWLKYILVALAGISIIFLFSRRRAVPFWRLSEGLCLRVF